MKQRLRIVVGGFLGLTPGGGVAWDYVQWPLGFSLLGHDVLYVEDTRLWPIYDAQGARDCMLNVARVSSVMESFGLSSRWAYRDEVSGECFGVALQDLRRFCRSADVFVNVSCSTYLRDEYREIPVRALVDTDPMFTQIQFCNQVSFTSNQAGMREMFEGHTHHFTFGENIGRSDCAVPECGISWRTIRQPICLPYWSMAPMPTAKDAAFTTIMNWTAARDLDFAGEIWGQKNKSLMRFLDLPKSAVDIPLAIAVSQTAGSPFPASLFRDYGWTVLNPNDCVPDWSWYRNFLHKSLGEFSVAKETYTKARTGWFSCRSACYLAAGRPVVTEDTGWSAYIPSGKGLLAFHDTETATEALRSVVAQPEEHSKAAREIADAYFSSDSVLSKMLDDLGIQSSQNPRNRVALNV